MRIYHKSGIVVESDTSSIVLDPHRRHESMVVSHAHLDHLYPGALMTHPTKDFLKIRKHSDDATASAYGEKTDVGDFEVMLHDGGHVFGSAMIKIDDILYTGDFNPEGGITCGKAEPADCETLIIESTYGRADFSLPPKDLVVSDLQSWIADETRDNAVALIGYSFGKAQELIAIANAVDVPVVVTQEIADISAVYKKYGIPLDYSVLTDDALEALNRAPGDAADDETAALLRDPHVLIIPQKVAKMPYFGRRRREGMRAAYISGWAWKYNFFRTLDIDVQFPLSDHADYQDLLAFVDACSPRRVYTCHGFAKNLARVIERDIGCTATALEESHSTKKRAPRTKSSMAQPASASRPLESF